MTFEELKDFVRKKRFGTSQYDNIDGETVYLSCGVREIFLDSDHKSQLVDVVRAFRKGDYGTAAEYGKNPRPGHEYGRYDCGLITDAGQEDAGVWIHRAEDALLVYFRFER